MLVACVCVLESLLSSHLTQVNSLALPQQPVFRQRLGLGAPRCAGLPMQRRSTDTKYAAWAQVYNSVWRQRTKMTGR